MNMQVGIINLGAALSHQTQEVITYLDISEDKTTGNAIHCCATHFVFTVTLRTINTISHCYEK